LLYFGQRRIIFEPQCQLSHLVPADFPLTYESVEIPTVNQGKLVGWWFPCNHPDARTALFLHGNCGYDPFNFQTIQILHNLGFAVLMFNYRGYGLSSNIFPNERRVYEDAEAGYNFLIQNQGIQPKNLLVYGHSLGGAIAVELVTRRPAAGLVLESTFASMLEMSIKKPLFAFFPINRLLHQRFDSRQKIPKLHLPIFFCHAALDDTVPSFMSEQLMAIANEPKRLEIVAEADHHNLAEVGKNTLIQGIQWLCQQLQWQYKA
jgi:pimeloyl-ACP methyl ester carboxylesterase